MSPVSKGRIIGYNSNAVFVETCGGEGLVFHRRSGKRTCGNNLNNQPRLAPGRDQYRGYTTSFLKNARPELAYANPGSFNDLMQALSGLMEAVAVVLDEQENREEPKRPADRIRDLDNAYRRTVESLESIRAEGVT